MLKIQTLNSIAEIGLKQFPQELYYVDNSITSPDAILLRSYNMHETNIPQSVKVVGRAGAGVNNIPIAALTARGIPILNTPGANANAVRELVIAGMLMASRNIFKAWNYVNSLKLNPNNISQHVEQNKKKFIGVELLGKTLGVIGLGSVGVKVANAALELGMNIIGYDPTITVERAWELSSTVIQAKHLKDLLEQSDFVTLHVPLLPETKKMINAERLNEMKNGVVLLNFSREDIVDNEALLSAMQIKKVQTYVTDFPSFPMIEHPDVICLPHLGASTKEAEENCAIIIVKQIRDFFEKGTISFSVNFPSLEMAPNGNAFRLAITNLNIPNMVAQISAKLAAAKLNIVSLMNKSRDNIAYTLIDIDNDINTSLIKEITSIDGVIDLRKII